MIDVVSRTNILDMEYDNRNQEQSQRFLSRQQNYFLKWMGEKREGRSTFMGDRSGVRFETVGRGRVAAGYTRLKFG